MHAQRERTPGVQAGPAGQLVAIDRDRRLGSRHPWRLGFRVMATEDILQRLAALADEIGPALVPPGHDELLESIAETARTLFGAAACSIALLEESEGHQPRLVFKAA